MKRRMMLGCLVVMAACGSSDDGTEATGMSKAEVAQLTVDGKADFGHDACAVRGWYDDDVCDWFCLERDPVCPQGSALANPEGIPTRFPILVTHGIMAGPDIGPILDVAETLRADGHVVYEGRTFPVAASAKRAELLAEQVDDILRETGARKVNIIAHSQGGLDSRHLITNLGYEDRVATLTTLHTPHRGSNMADAALDLLNPRRVELVNAIAKILFRDAGDLMEDPDFGAALTDLSEANAPFFNADTPDSPHVLYQSWAGVSNVAGLPNPRDFLACHGMWWGHEEVRDVMSPVFKLTAAQTAHGRELRPNDGVVTVESAKWGLFRGCLPADHGDIVGQFNDGGQRPLTGFDHRQFYRLVAFELAAWGY